MIGFLVISCYHIISYRFCITEIQRDKIESGPVVILEIIEV